MTGLPDTQLVLRPGIVEMNWGNPDPDLLPVAAIRRAAELALERDGSRALAYGAEQGPGRLLEPLAAWLARREDVPLRPEQLFITGGVSQGLDLLCTLLAQPGQVALVEAPTYHLALRIFRDHRLELAPVACDEWGLRLDALEAALEAVHRRGQQVSFSTRCPPSVTPAAGLCRWSGGSDWWSWLGRSGWQSSKMTSTASCGMTRRPRRHSSAWRRMGQ